MALCVLLLNVTLAGCFGGNGDNQEVDVCEDEQVLCNPEEYFGDHFCEKNNVRPRVYAPDTQGPDNDASPWNLGDSWEYSLNVDGEDLGRTELIYYDIQDGGAHYMAGTPTREEALQHALFSTNPVIGRIHRTLYSPHESGSHADMFLFPLCQGSTWQDTFFGTEFTFTARQQSITLPDGHVDPLGFRIDGTAADGSKVMHTYSPVAKWFTAIHLDRADGATVDMELTDMDAGYKGSAYFLRGQKDEIIDLAPIAQSREISISRADGGEGPYDKVGIHLDVTRASGNGRVDVLVRNPDDQVVACFSIAGTGTTGGGARDDCLTSPGNLEADYQEGTWTVEVSLPLLGGTRIDGEVRIVSMYDRSGST